ncbi:unnamed protein product [Angiostrongylus costaricensis]|uniref:Bromo domain-containing protein n=1 Tax=Angiostrongylus costaricensis TaxID=334426 RepID=A0A3P7I3P1_ANGCS|nr:unnamed protein product [Angiostrongylus costaricensis]
MPVVVTTWDKFWPGCPQGREPRFRNQQNSKKWRLCGSLTTQQPTPIPLSLSCRIFNAFSNHPSTGSSLPFLFFFLTFCTPRYRSYVACAICFRWFHGDCAGLSQVDAKETDGWSCRECSLLTQKSHQDQKKPYGLTGWLSRFYVGCESCKDWFHPRCVGITKEEAEAMAEYMCPTCVEAQIAHGYESTSSSASGNRATLCRADYALIWRLLECVNDHEMSCPFRQPVSLEEFPNYLDVVKNPIDLSIIQKRLETLEYQRLKDFTADMSRLFENAKLFYAQGSDVYKSAETLEKLFEDALADVRAEIGARDNGRKVSQISSISSLVEPGNLPVSIPSPTFRAQQAIRRYQSAKHTLKKRDSFP